MTEQRSMIEDLRRGTPLENRAADEIERLRAEIERKDATLRDLIEALERNPTTAPVVAAARAATLEALAHD